MENSEISKHVVNILIRDFKHKLNFHIFNEIVYGGGIDNISKETFSGFVLTDDIISNYTYSLQLEGNRTINNKTMNDIDADFKKWDRGKENLLLNEFKKYFPSEELEKTIEVLYSENLYNNSPQCHYCGITKNIIQDIIDKTSNDISSNKRFHTKRFYNRGKSMEIDQRKPNMGYIKNNMVLCCYWCNNAKSDEFTYDEFKKYIAPQIRNVWEKRFGDQLPPEPEIIIDADSI